MSGYGVSTQEKDLSKFALGIQSALNGRSNATGTFTLTPGATSTTVIAPNCAPQCAVIPFQKTANAAAAMATMWVSAVGNKQFTITHANNAQTDRTFFYVCLG